MSTDGFFTAAEMAGTGRHRLTMVAECDACGLHKKCRSPMMPFDGRGERRILVVAEAPGQQEDDANRPLVGPTGQRLRDEIGRFGVDLRRDCWLTNALICRPPGNKLADYPGAVDYCRPNLLRTVRELDPEVIILLGGAAIKSVIGHLYDDSKSHAVNRWAGWTIPSQAWNAWIVPTYHPSYLLKERDPVLDLEFSEHLRAASKLSGRPWPDGPPNWDRGVEVVLSDAQAAGYLEHIRGGEIAFDLETNMLKPDSAASEIRCCAVTTARGTFAFPWRGRAVAAMRELLADPAVGKIAQNLQMEHRWIYEHLGVRVRGWSWDTMTAGHAADCRRAATGLDFLAFVHLGLPQWDRATSGYLESAVSGGNAANRIRDCDLRSLLVYCGVDTIASWELALRQRKEFGP